MTRDGFGTLSSGLVARGTQRVRDILGDAGPAPRYGGERCDTKRGPDERNGARGAGHLRSLRNPVVDDRRPHGADALRHAGRTGPAHDVPLVSWGADTDLPGNETRVIMTVANPQPEVPPDDGSVPPARSSTAYVHRSLTDNAERLNGTGEAAKPPARIETPAYSGPDRRQRSVSPTVERRRSVAPRIKAGVRLEQERYLRLKLAARQTGRTQQDLLTAALDAYLDLLRIDHFVRVSATSDFGSQSSLTARSGLHSR